MLKLDRTVQTTKDCDRTGISRLANSCQYSPVVQSLQCVVLVYLGALDYTPNILDMNLKQETRTETISLHCVAEFSC
jgi:hypothetical protein